jgi:hypothetical protein
VFRADALGFQFAGRNGFTFTPADDGTYKVTLTVTDDGATTLTRQVLVQNVNPTIDTFVVPSSATEGDTVKLTATAHDPADPLTYTWVVTERLTGNTTTLTGATVTITPTAGDYSVMLAVSNGDGGLASRATQLTLANVPPVITPGSFQVPTTGVEGGTATFSVAATDTAPGLTYAWLVGPTGAATTLSGATVNYQWPDDGTYTVSVTVTDSAGASVAVGPASVAVANVAPTITSAAAPATGREGVCVCVPPAPTARRRPRGRSTWRTCRRR